MEEHYGNKEEKHSQEEFCKEIFFIKKILIDKRVLILVEENARKEVFRKKIIREKERLEKIIQLAQIQSRRRKSRRA